MKNLLTKLSFIALFGLLALGACKKEDEKPAHFGKWKLTKVQEINYENNVKTYDSTINFGLETIIWHFKDATNMDWSETDETGAVIDTENYTYKIENGNLIVTDPVYGDETFTNFNINGNNLSARIIEEDSDSKYEGILTLVKM